MICPKCKGDDISVIDSRENGQNVVRRRRRCCDCDYAFTTYEIYAEKYRDLMAMNNFVDMLKRFVRGEETE